MSKGSTPRARQVSREEFERRWAETFGGGRKVRDAIERRAVEVLAAAAGRTDVARMWEEIRAEIAKPFQEVNAVCTGNVDDLPMPTIVDDATVERDCFGATAADQAKALRLSHLADGVSTATGLLYRSALPQADGDPGDDYAVERAGA